MAPSDYPPSNRAPFYPHRRPSTPRPSSPFTRTIEDPWNVRRAQEVYANYRQSSNPRMDTIADDEYFPQSPVLPKYWESMTAEEYFPQSPILSKDPDANGSRRAGRAQGDSRTRDTGASRNPRGDDENEGRVTDSYHHSPEKIAPLNLKGMNTTVHNLLPPISSFDSKPANVQSAHSLSVNSREHSITRSPYDASRASTDVRETNKAIDKSLPTTSRLDRRPMPHAQSDRRGVNRHVGLVEYEFPSFLGLDKGLPAELNRRSGLTSPTPRPPSPQVSTRSRAASGNTLPLGNTAQSVNAPSSVNNFINRTFDRPPTPWLHGVRSQMPASNAQLPTPQRQWISRTIEDPPSSDSDDEESYDVVPRSRSKIPDDELLARALKEDNKTLAKRLHISKKTVARYLTQANERKARKLGSDPDEVVAEYSARRFKEGTITQERHNQILRKRGFADWSKHSPEEIQRIRDSREKVKESGKRRREEGAGKLREKQREKDWVKERDRRERMQAAVKQGLSTDPFKIGGPPKRICFLGGADNCSHEWCMAQNED